MVQKNDLTQDVFFMGEQANPYPYYKISDCVILSSDYEGYPVVFLESYVLNKPIITTKVSDYEDIQNVRGIVTEKNVQSIYMAMKEFIKNGYNIQNKFEIKKYNKEVEQKLYEILEKF